MSLPKCKSAIHTAVVSHPKRFIYTAAVYPAGQRHIIISPIDAHYKCPRTKFIHTFHNSKRSPSPLAGKSTFQDGCKCSKEIGW